MIPKVIHQIWLGEKVPEQVQAYIDSVRAAYEPRGWTTRLWRDADAEELPQECRDKMARCRHPIPASDIMRYYIIAKHGGVYLDVDMEPTENFLDTALPEDADVFVLAYNNTIYTNNCLFGASPDHEFFRRVSEMCVGGGSVLLSSGGVFLGQMVHRYSTRVGAIFRVPENAHFFHHTELLWDSEVPRGNNIPLANPKNIRICQQNSHSLPLEML